jgi:hypothetical protein
VVRHSLWVGCVNVHDYGKQEPSDLVPQGKDVVWTCVVVAEVSLFKRLFLAPNNEPQATDLFMRIKRLLSSVPDTYLVDEP